MAVAFTAPVWLVFMSPGVSLVDLRELALRAAPVVEKQTGMSFRTPVRVEFGFEEDVRRKPRDLAPDGGDASSSFRPDCIGLCSQDGKVVYVIPDAIRRCQLKGILARTQAGPISRALLVEELVHAIDGQNGLMPDRTELVASAKSDLSRFLVTRAIEEGRSHYFGTRACAELGIAPLSDFTVAREAAPDRDHLAQLGDDTLRFIYSSGPRFFEALAAAGRQDLIARASSRLPLWAHYIERPSVYARDVDEGFEDVFRGAFQCLERIFPASSWRPAFKGTWGLAEKPAYMGPEPDTAERVECDGLKIAEWLGSFQPIEKDARVALWLWRFADAGNAKRGSVLRRAIIAAGALSYGDAIVFRDEVFAGADSAISGSVVDPEDDRELAYKHCFLLVAGEFLLSVKARDMGEGEVRSLVERLASDLLEPLGSPEPRTPNVE